MYFVRKLRKDDSETLFKIKANLSKQSEYVNKSTFDDIMLQLEAFDHKNDSGWFGAFYEGKLVGILFVSQVQQSTHIGLLAVDQAFYGKGVSLALFMKVKELAISANRKIITLNVDDDNKVAFSLYKRMGFQERQKNKFTTMSFKLKNNSASW